MERREQDLLTRLGKSSWGDYLSLQLGSTDDDFNQNLVPFWGDFLSLRLHYNENPASWGNDLSLRLGGTVHYNENPASWGNDLSLRLGSTHYNQKLVSWGRYLSLKPSGPVDDDQKLVYWGRSLSIKPSSTLDDDDQKLVYWGRSLSLKPSGTVDDDQKLVFSTTVAAEEDLIGGEDKSSWGDDLSLWLGSQNPLYWGHFLTLWPDSTIDYNQNNLVSSTTVAAEALEPSFTLQPNPPGEIIMNRDSTGPIINSCHECNCYTRFF